MTAVLCSVGFILFNSSTLKHMVTFGELIQFNLTYDTEHVRSRISRGIPKICLENDVEDWTGASVWRVGRMAEDR